MRKLAFIIISLAVLVLSACGGQTKQHYSSGKVSKVKYHTLSSRTSDDTVLWINSDGTDCDYGDLLEGDKDCYKTHKTTYYKTPKKSLLSKLKKTHHVTTTTTTTTTHTVTKPKTKVIVPTKPKTAPKKTVTYKRTTPKTSSYSKSRTTTKTTVRTTTRKRR